MHQKLHLKSGNGMFSYLACAIFYLELAWEDDRDVLTLIASLSRALQKLRLSCTSVALCKSLSAVAIEQAELTVSGMTGPVSASISPPRQAHMR